MSLSRLVLVLVCAVGCAATAEPGGSGGSGGNAGGGTPGSGGSGGGSGGAGGSGGGSADIDMIDDLEDGDASIINGGMPPRVGAWYTYHDTSPAGMMIYPMGEPFVPSPGGAHGSAFCARAAGSGFTMWGAGMGFNLNDPGDGRGGSAKMTYDGSGFQGLTFWVKGAAPGRLRVNISNKDTDPAGGTCMAVECNDHFGAAVPVTTDWTQVTIMFSELRQVGFGTPVAMFDAHALYAIQFQVSAMPFDFSVDDVAFLR